MTHSVALFSHTSIAGGLLYRLIIDSLQGEKISGFVKSRNNTQDYIGKFGQKEARVRVKDVYPNGLHFRFVMIIENNDMEAVFDEVVGSIRFK